MNDESTVDFNFGLQGMWGWGLGDGVRIGGEDYEHHEDMRIFLLFGLSLNSSSCDIPFGSVLS